MERCRKAGPRTKLSLVSSAREWKWSRGHREASWKTRSSLRHVWAKLFRLFLSRKEKRCRRHSQFSSVRRIALCAWAAKAAGSPRRARGLISFQRLQIPCTNMVWNGSYFWLPAGRDVSKKDKAPASLSCLPEEGAAWPCFSQSGLQRATWPLLWRTWRLQLRSMGLAENLIQGQRTGHRQEQDSTLAYLCCQPEVSRCNPTSRTLGFKSAPTLGSCHQQAQHTEWGRAGQTPWVGPLVSRPCPETAEKASPGKSSLAPTWSSLLL